MGWLRDLFGVVKPIIGMCHLQPLPGDPSYDAGGGMSAVVRLAAREIAALHEGGVDGILISNEFSLPYLTRTEPITAAAMARVVGELRADIGLPYGINVLWDGQASLDVAVATGAAFVREVFSGVYASDFGLWNTNVGAMARHRRAIDGQDVRMLFNIVPEAAIYLGGRHLASIATSTVFNAAPDGLCVSGVTAGAQVDREALRTVRAAAGSTPVIVNTGVTESNIADLLAIADGAIVGTFLKKDGVFENPADPVRMKALIAAARPAREMLGS